MLFEGTGSSRSWTATALKAFRRQAQLMFQNPYEALNPRFTIERAILEPLIIHGLTAIRKGGQRVGAGAGSGEPAARRAPSCTSTRTR